MKKIWMITTSVLLLMTFIPVANAQEEEKASNWSAGLDIYSNYVWRGTKLGTGPAFQPSVKFTTGGLTVGVWGSFDAAGYTEADPYISYSFPFGLSLGLTDYYFPTHSDSTGLVGSDFSDFDKATTYHALEINGGYTLKGLSLSANYILNESGGALSSGGDLYFQAGYAFSNCNISVGAGNGWHTTDTEFNVCHIALGTSKTIELSEKFSIPVNGSIIFNPDRNQLFVVVGISL